MTTTLDEIDTSAVPDRFAAMEKAFGSAPALLPTLTPAAKEAAPKPRRNSSISMPLYVWELLREEGFKTRQTQNVIIMKGLKAMGLPIAEEDLVDCRGQR